MEDISEVAEVTEIIAEDPMDDDFYVTLLFADGSKRETNLWRSDMLLEDEDWDEAEANLRAKLTAVQSQLERLSTCRKHAEVVKDRED